MSKQILSALVKGRAAKRLSLRSIEYEIRGQREQETARESHGGSGKQNSGEPGGSSTDALGQLKSTGRSDCDATPEPTRRIGGRVLVAASELRKYARFGPS